MPDSKRLDLLAEKARIKLGLTEQELKRLQQAAWTAYEEVAYDLVPDNRKRQTCRRSTVIEIVMDCDRVKFQVQNYYESEPLSAAMEKALHYEQHKALLQLIGPAFPYQEYEVGNQEAPCLS